MLYTVDLRTHDIQTREVRDGVSMLFQYRTVIHNPNGSKDVGGWKTSGTCPNYGDVYDDKDVSTQDKVTPTLSLFFVVCIFGFIYLTYLSN